MKQERICARQHSGSFALKFSISEEYGFFFGEFVDTVVFATPSKDYSPST